MRNRRLALALLIVAAGMAASAPARAQFREFFHNPFWGGGYQSPGYNPFYPRPQAPTESIRPPAPHKVETPPTQTVVVIGDSLADWLGYGLEEAFADTPEIGVERKIKPYAGLIRYEARPDSPDWAQAIKDVLAAEKPAAIVVMLGVNDRLPLRERVAPPKSSSGGAGAAGAAQGAQGQGAAQQPAAAAAAASPPSGAASTSTDTPPADSEQPASAPADTQRRPGGLYEFRSDPWGELYAKRIDEMIAALKSKGVPVLWVGMPAIRGAKSTSDMSYLDELYRARAEKAGIVYVDIWDGFVDERGNYAQQGPDFEGQTRRLRTYDGVHFTKAGAEKLAHYVEHELRRVLTNRLIPVALPGPEEQAPKGAARPAIGPIVPLNVIGSDEGGDLLGATNRPAQHESDPVATQVLSRGEAIAAPPGRADDFSWPRANAEGGSATDAAPAAQGPGPGPGPKGGESKKPDGKTTDGKIDGRTEAKPDGPAGGKADTKTDAKPDVRNEPRKAPTAIAPAAPATPKVTPQRPRQTRDDLDGAPRPPLSIGGAPANNIR
jgi:uncharacterized protein